MVDAKPNPRRAAGRLQSNRWTVGVAFCLPLILGLLCLTVFPVGASLFFSLTDYPIFDAPKWRGPGNYGELLRDPRVWLSLWNTAYFAIFAVPLGMFAGLVLALLLNLRIRGMAFYRTMFFLPSIMPLIATCVLWNKVLSPQQGLVNSALRGLGLPEGMVPGWLTDVFWAKPALVLMSVWGCGGGMVLYLAALQDVPQELYESAEIDGAGPLRRLWHITLPMISPMLLFTLIMGLIGTMQYFAQAYVMTSGGPWDSTLFYALYLFNNAFTEFRLGYASAMAWVMFAIILTATLILMRVTNRYVYYHS
jgi:multiple sugar transport system permease protein